MKALSILGTSSQSGKSWFTTALCRLLARQGLNVAPFKAQNMSNNSYVTVDGGEIGRAQAVQAEACGLQPTVEMNPILLKPSGGLGSQLVVLGTARGHVKARDYYRKIEEHWEVVKASLAHWQSRCDVLILEGAGSPVELNLMEQDIVNLRPMRELDGRWLLVSDIERGGVFAQIIGTYSLLKKTDQARGLGVLVNKFRGDLSLFSAAEKNLANYIDLPFLGTLPYQAELQPESEDSLCQEAETGQSGDALAWIRWPHLSNSQDAQPWRQDQGVKVIWAESPADLIGAKAIILPGSKNTQADLAWLKSKGFVQPLLTSAASGIPIVGICGGYQMLGESLIDSDGVAGDRGVHQGLNLLPIRTIFQSEKKVTQIEAHWNSERWTAYEIHMGQTEKASDCPALLEVKTGGVLHEEGCQKDRIWGTYLHGLFESAQMRQRLADTAGLKNYVGATTNWREQQNRIYDGMADLIEEHLNLEKVLSYVAS